jgi:hypothetical protein
MKATTICYEMSLVGRFYWPRFPRAQMGTSQP